MQLYLLNLHGKNKIRNQFCFFLSVKFFYIKHEFILKYVENYNYFLKIPKAFCKAQLLDVKIMLSTYSIQGKIICDLQWSSTVHPLQLSHSMSSCTLLWAQGHCHVEHVCSRSLTVVAVKGKLWLYSIPIQFFGSNFLPAVWGRPTCRCEGQLSTNLWNIVYPVH